MHNSNSKMEKKQLNFSAPLLSARRYSSPLRPSREEDSPPRKSIPSEVVKPGTVPFMWEQIPGKSKTSTESLVQSPEEFPSIPKLPPAFLSRKSGESSGFRTPSKFSGELYTLSRPNKFSGELYTHSKPHKFSGELNAFQPCQNKLSAELRILTKYSYPSLNDTTTESEDENEDAHTFSDALDTFSQFDSSSLNCSMTGLSGFQQPEPKYVANSAIEPRNRDFMMDRFLPAAKAMTLEPSQYAARKQLVAMEKHKQVNAMVPRLSGNVCNIVEYMGQDIGSEQSEFDDQQSAVSVKVKGWRFLPWFCSKRSIRLLNPLPSMKNGSKSVLSSASKVGKLVKNRSWRSPSPKLDKHVPCTNNNHKVGPTFKSCELQKPKLISRPMFYSGELQKPRSISPYRNSSRRNSPSVYRNQSPLTLYNKGLGVLAVPKRVNPYDETRMSYGSKSGRLDIMKARGMSGPLNFSKMGENGNRNTCTELVVVGDDQGGAQSPFTPPLPKSPSESWLSRNLASVSPRNSVSYAKAKPKKQNGNGAPAIRPKWETIVKSSHLHHDLGRYSEELVTHVTQRPQTRK